MYLKVVLFPSEQKEFSILSMMSETEFPLISSTSDPAGMEFVSS